LCAAEVSARLKEPIDLLIAQVRGDLRQLLQNNGKAPFFLGSALRRVA
jgi:hypothetical protein